MAVTLYRQVGKENSLQINCRFLSHIKSILDKLQANDRTHAVTLAVRRA